MLLKLKTRFGAVNNFVKRHILAIALLISFAAQLSAIVEYDAFGEFTTTNFRHGGLFHDTPSYIVAANDLAHGSFNDFRTPVYPALIAVAQFISAKHFAHIIIVVQLIVFYISMIYLYRLCRRLKLSPYISLAVLMIHGCLPMNAFWNTLVQTESLAISISVIFCYRLVDWYRNAVSWRKTTLLCLDLTLLLFLRPSFLYLIIVVAITAILLLSIHRRRHALHALACLAVSGSLMIGYCADIQAKVGVFTPSTVAIHNDEVNALDIGLLKSENISNPTLKQRVKDFEAIGHRINVWDAPDFYGLPDTLVYNGLQSLKNIDRAGWYRKVLTTNFNASLLAPAIGFKYRAIKFPVVYILLIAAAIAGLLYWYRQHRPPLIDIAFWLMCVGNIAVDLLGSFAEWRRLFAPSAIIFVVLLAHLITLKTKFFS
jgi:hypothetical protein